MQISALRNDNPFDALTLSLSSTGSLREGLNLVGAFLKRQLVQLFGSSRPMAVPASRSRFCLTVKYWDGLCEIGEKTVVPGFTASVNGCGAASGLKFPDHFGSAYWRAACDIHDLCYASCTRPKSICDRDIETDIASACRIAYPGIIFSLPRVFCYGIARAYRAAVSSQFGTNAWIDAQLEACQCCNKCEAGLTGCGSECCEPGEMCCNGRCLRQGQCCSENQIYCAGQCIDPSQRQCCRNAAGEFICATHQSCCGNGTCCNVGSTCCEKNGTRSCVPAGDQNCNFQCTPCLPNQHCCLTPWGSSWGCCESDERCDPIHNCVKQ